MCGITGYVGDREAAPLLLRALRKLEYRGYDSAGIAVLDDARHLSVCKAKGRLSALEERLGGKPPRGTLGIGHTRWATHGEPSDINSHPHTDFHGRIAVVHNGIIENYERSKRWLEARGVVFQSDTDTEVIAHLISYYYHGEQERAGAAKPGVEMPLLAAVLAALDRLEGSYALAVVAADCPDRIVAARKDSPLIIGLGEGAQFLASDVPALLEHTREVYFLEDNEAAVLYRGHVDLYSREGERVLREPVHIDWDAEAAEKGGYPHFMLKEIYEQPQALAATLRPHLQTGEDGARTVFFEDPRVDKMLISAPRVVFTACGTAWHAALVGKYLFERLARIPVEVETASEYRYRDPVLNAGDLVIVISQSGETADTLAAARLVQKKGAALLAITNVVGSTLAREAGVTLYTRAGPEIAVASTKAFTTQLMSLSLLALRAALLRRTLAPREAETLLAALEAIPAGAEKTLARAESIQRLAARQFNKNKVFFMGRQFDYPAALESALKLKEISYTHSEAFAAGELKHGPIALLDSGTLVVTFATQRALFDKIASNIREVTSRGASSLIITWEGEGEAAFSSLGGELFSLPETCAPFSPLLSVIPAQLFAYFCAVQHGNDPDKPRNLAKSVTVE
jgi:glucosamine--fructose-6-phosphate aminotransferase (isomerizing)